MKSDGNISKTEYKLTTEKIKTILVLLISFILAQLSEFHNVTILKLLGFFIVFIYSLLVDKKTVLYILMFFMPANRLFTYRGVSLNLIVISVFFIKNILRKERIGNRLLFWSLILFLYSFIYFFWFSSMSEMLQVVKTLMLLYLCIEVFSKVNEELLDLYENAILFLSIGLVSQILVAVIINPNVLNLDRFALSNDSNANALAIICSYAIAQIVVMLDSEYIAKKKYYFVLLILIALIGIYTQSRTFTIGFTISIFCFILQTGKKFSLKSLSRLFILFLIIIGFYYFLTYSDGIISGKIWSAINRVIIPSRGDITNRRFLIWSMYIDALKSDTRVLLFGVGNDYGRLGISMMAHNGLLEQIAAYGLIGSFLFLIWYLDIAIVIVRRLRTNYLFTTYFNFLPLLIVLSSGMFSHSFMSINSTLQIFLGVIAMFIVPRYQEKNYLKNEGDERL